MVVAGGALVQSSAQLASRIRAIAAHRLEASEDDIELVDGAAQVVGSPSSGIQHSDLARTAWLGWDLPEGCVPGLEEQSTYDPPDITYWSATHAAAVAVDLGTGLVEVEDYWVVHDSGTIVNPDIADGQIRGGVAQGIGIALHEEVVYGDDAQPSLSTFMDYLLPAASDVPDVRLDHMETPSLHTPGGMKGLGEGGVIPAPAAIGNAISAAVPEIAQSVTATPLSPSHLWGLINEAGLSG